MEEIISMAMSDELISLTELAGRQVLKLIAAALIFLVGRWVASRLAKLLRKGLVRADMDATLVGFVGNLAYFGILTLVVIAAVGQLGVQTTSFIAVLGAAGLAVGLALQGSLSNFAAGVLIIIFRPFRVGNFVEAAGTSGIVEEIQIFTTVLRTPDNKTVVIPNSQVTNGTITNYSARDTRRLDLVFQVSYGDDLDKVKQVIRGVLGEEPRLLKEPEPLVAVSKLGDSGVDLIVRPWVNSPDYWPVFFSLQEQMKKRFDQEGICIPFPQRDVHLYKPSA